MKIAVAGSGYVGLSLGVLLSLQNEVTIFPLKLIRLIMAYRQFKMNILNIT
ncbi:UDP-glucose 6-dehydrogenase [Streptococcus pyogenes]|nr:UDP-glucose 6-dehydrogenase [Streptococcus pyogenes]